MGRANNSRVDTTKGDRLAQKTNLVRNMIKAGFDPEGLDKKDQVINARKATVVIDAQKEKRKRNAKLAKAAKKKNKK